MNYTLHHGDCLEELRKMPDNSVHCCVTSPPYWGLRDYGTATWEGGDAACDHKQSTSRQDGGRVNTNGFHGSSRQDSDKGAKFYRDTCPKCGAVRIDSQLGLESTPEAYVARLVEMFREVRRVLRADGTCWLNLGDSMLPNKCEAMIPHRVAMALMEDGWICRQTIIWHKPNPMPESVTDRCTKAHEYMFLLTKSARYFYDAAAIAEAVSGDAHGGNASFGGKKLKMLTGKQQKSTLGPSGIQRMQETRNRRSVWSITTQPYSGAHFATMPPDLAETCILAGCPVGGVVLDPFAGSGTTLAVAVANGRFGVGIELNADYHELARQRLERTQLPLVMAAD